MAMLGVMFNASAAASATDSLAAASLAKVFVDLMLQKEDYLRALRALLREIVRVLRFDSAVNLPVFCKTLMAVDSKMEAQLRDFEHKERFFTSVVDLVVISIFLGISPAVREALNGHKKDLSPYKLFLRQTCLIQRDAVIWMYESVMNVFKPEASYTQCLHRLLFLFLNEEQWRADGWPTDQDRGFFARACQEVYQ